MNIPQDLRYSKEHEWVRVEGNIGTIGITDFAQSELGELVYIEIDSVGEDLSKDDVFGTVEAVKTTSELFMPISGKVIEFNDELSEKGGDNPAIINEDPYGKGWIVKIEIADESELDDLLSPEQYAELID
jgi:glycine cleavage system H protein